ncbi:unnamed protein product [Effrenium voratum]|nr:unnamed protein product [Effrenium voratum]
MNQWQHLHTLSHWLRRYREVASVAGLLCALWQRRQWMRTRARAAAAVRAGRFMEQCTFLLVNVEGMMKDANPASTVSVQTLFSRTLKSLMFDNEKMVELVSQAAERATPVAPLLELGSDAWLVMANLNAHLMEACCSRGHVAAACGTPVHVVEFIYGLVNDRTTNSRQQLRVYVIRERDLRNLPEAKDLDLRRCSFKSAYSVLRIMAFSYQAPALYHNVLSMTSGLPSGMGRTWLTFPAGILCAL